MDHREAALTDLLRNLYIVHADLADARDRRQPSGGRRDLRGAAGEGCEVGLHEILAHGFDLIIQLSVHSLLLFKLLLEVSDTGIA